MSFNAVKCFTLLLLAGSLQLFAQTASPATPPSLLVSGEEKHLRNIRQLTFGGQNAEAYFSADNKMLIFQHQGNARYTVRPDLHHRGGYARRQAGHPETGELGKGRTTCSYIFPDGNRILYSSTDGGQSRLPAQARLFARAMCGRSMTPTRSTPPSRRLATSSR